MMKSITVDANRLDAYAIVQLPANTVEGTFAANPILMDTLLHAAGSTTTPVTTRCFKPEVQYCNIGFLSDTLAVADAYAFELGTPEVTIVAHMKRMPFRKLRMSGFQAILAFAAGTTTRRLRRLCKLQRVCTIPSPTRCFEGNEGGIQGTIACM